MIRHCFPGVQTAASPKEPLACRGPVWFTVLITTLMVLLALSGAGAQGDSQRDALESATALVSTSKAHSPFDVEVFDLAGRLLHAEVLTSDKDGVVDLTPVALGAWVDPNGPTPALLVLLDGKTVIAQRSLEDPDDVLARLAKSARYEAFLHEVRKQEPDPEIFELVGTVPVTLDGAEFDEILHNYRDEDDPDVPGGDLEILVSADGRMYRERPGVRSTPSSSSLSMGGKPEGSDTPEHLALAPPSGSLVSLPTGVIVGGSDDRELRTSSSYPWRAVGVALRHPTNINDIKCSAAMIGHRSVLTAAHCVSDDGNNLKVREVAPAARGIGYNGNRSPFGNRYVEWYSWPNGWSGGGVRYDYAVLRLTDINWSPGHIFFGYQSTIWLDYKNYNSAGYPGEGKDCDDSPINSGAWAGKCAGYMYYQYAKVTAVGASGMWNEFDAQPGQSGSALYFKSGNTRTIYGIQDREGNNLNLAHKIRSGSFGFMCNALAAAPSSYFPNPHC